LKVHFGWGAEDIQSGAVAADAVVIIDTLRFTSCVSVAVSRGVAILPYRWRDESAEEYAKEYGAELAGPRETAGVWSLSPTDLMKAPAGLRLVLPSPNGATLSLLAFASGAPNVFAGSLRNRTAVAKAIVRSKARAVLVIAAGERWPDADGEHTGPLRPAFEDMLGAGAVIDALRGDPSPEAEAAAAVFRDASAQLLDRLSKCSSGVELIERGWEDDVRTCAELDADVVAPRFDGEAYVPA
jgi:2-phosphosulfolactate phosphatase